MYDEDLTTRYDDYLDFIEYELSCHDDFICSVLENEANNYASNSHHEWEISCTCK